MKDIITIEDMNTEISSMGSVGSTYFDWNGFDPKDFVNPGVSLQVQSRGVPGPEGRVHGGGLMAMLASGRNQAPGGPSEQGSSVIPHNWM